MPLRARRRHRRRPDRRLVRARAEAGAGACGHVVGVGRTRANLQPRAERWASSIRSPRDAARCGARRRSRAARRAGRRRSRSILRGIAPALRADDRRHRCAAAPSATWSPRRARRSERRSASSCRRIRSRAREKSGAGAACAELFREPAAWSSRRCTKTRRSAVEKVEHGLVEACGARIAQHDAERARRGVRGGEPPAARARLRAGARDRRARQTRTQLFSLRRRRLPRLHAHRRAATRRCGATSASRTATALLDELDAIDAELEALRDAARGAATAAALEKLFARTRARSRWLRRAA